MTMTSTTTTTVVRSGISGARNPSGIPLSCPPHHLKTHPVSQSVKSSAGQQAVINDDEPSSCSRCLNDELQGGLGTDGSFVGTEDPRVLGDFTRRQSPSAGKEEEKIIGFRAALSAIYWSSHRSLAAPLRSVGRITIHAMTITQNVTEFGDAPAAAAAADSTRSLSGRHSIIDGKLSVWVKPRFSVRMALRLCFCCSTVCLSVCLVVCRVVDSVSPPCR